MGLSEDLTRLVTEAKNSRKLVRPYSGELVRKLTREMTILYRSIETGFMPNATQTLSQLSLSQLTPIQVPNSQNSTIFSAPESTSSKKTTHYDAEVQALSFTPEAIHMQQLVYFLGLHRIKRALLIYHTMRLHTIQQEIWLTGHLPSESAYTGVTTPRRSHDIMKTFTIPRKNMWEDSFGKRQLTSSSSVSSTPKRVRHLSSRDDLSEAGSNSTSLISASESPRRTPLRASRSINGNDVSSNLSQAEINFGTAYQLLIGNISSQFPLVDLLGSLEPPKEVYLEVRVIRDCGDILTESGVISLEAGSQLFVRKTDVEQLLISGDIKAI